jgi:hypothetical protein
MHLLARGFAREWRNYNKLPNWLFRRRLDAAKATKEDETDRVARFQQLTA